MQRSEKPPGFRFLKSRQAIVQIAERLPDCLAEFSIARSQIIADQWVTAIRGGEASSIVAACVTRDTADGSSDLVSAAVALHSPPSDTATLLFASQIAQNVEPEKRESFDFATRHLADGLIEQLGRRGVEFMQWATDPVETGDHEKDNTQDRNALVSALAVKALGTLQYLALNDLSPSDVSPIAQAVTATERLRRNPVFEDNLFGSNASDADASEDDVQILASTPAIDAFALTVEQTYVQSLDCPGFAEFRTARQLLESYRESPTFHPAGWFDIHLAESVTSQLNTSSRQTRHAAAPIGVLIIAMHQKTDTAPVAELTYMGLVPEHRGRGLGADLLESAIAWARAVGCERLILAVDVDNAPAIDLYLRRGFQPILRESVWGRKIQIA